MVLFITHFLLQDVGYKGDLGYEMFLHGSHAEIRKVFLILIQKLPKANEQPIPESIGELLVLNFKNKFS